MKTIDMAATGRRIHARREKLGLRVAEVAEAKGEMREEEQDE